MGGVPSSLRSEAHGGAQEPTAPTVETLSLEQQLVDCFAEIEAAITSVQGALRHYQQPQDVHFHMALKACRDGAALASRVQAPKKVENREASTGDVPKQGSDPQRDLRDDATIAQVLAVIYAECDRQKIASNEAQQQIRLADMYRHNTALHALWAVTAKICALATTKVAEAESNGSAGSPSYGRVGELNSSNTPPGEGN